MPPGSARSSLPLPIRHTPPSVPHTADCLTSSGCTSRVNTQILSKLQEQLQQGPLPGTTGTELLQQGGSYGNGGRQLLLAKPGVVARDVTMTMTLTRTILHMHT
jgi:hypothetical protein